MSIEKMENIRESINIISTDIMFNRSYKPLFNVLNQLEHFMIASINQHKDTIERMARMESMLSEFIKNKEKEIL